MVTIHLQKRNVSGFSGLNGERFIELIVEIRSICLQEIGVENIEIKALYTQDKFFSNG
jgi:hypothetical protein